MECKTCGFEMKLPDDLEKNEIIECVDCAHEYEVDNVDPFVLKDAPECEEDWGE
jgi:alpha-aminoadipate/glutamate carrier protein LysW